jgi:hypothetical protein
MQKKQRFQPASYKTAEGKPDGIVTKFIKASKTSYNLQIERIPIESGRIKAIADSYRYILKWIDSQDEGTKEKFKSTRNRVKAQAESQIVKDGKVFDDHFELFHLDNTQLNRRIFLRKKLIEFCIEALNSPFLLPAIRNEAKGGYMVDYSKATALIEEYDKLLRIETFSRKNWTQEQIEQDREENPTDIGAEMTEQERHRKLLELSDKIGEELNLKNKEKGQRSNLCFFLLYDRMVTISEGYNKRIETTGIFSEPTPDELIINFVENEERFKEKLLDLSRTNLIEFIRIFCNAHNDFYSKEINQQRKANKMDNNDKRTKKKAFTSDEKRELIDLYKSCKMTQKELARELDCNTRTVRRLANG